MHHNGKGVIPIANTLDDLLKLADQYSANMEKILQTSKKYRSYQKMALTATQEFKSGLANIKNVSNDASNGIGKINQKISDTISKAKLGKKALDLMISGVKNGANQQVQEISLQSMLGSETAGSALYEYNEAYGAQKSVLGVAGVQNAAKAFLPYTHEPDELTRMYGLAERLYARDPSQGTDNAVSSVQALLAGDASGIQDNYHIAGVDEETVKGFTGSGDMGGAIDYLDGVFNNFGATQEMVDKNFLSLQTQAARFGENMQYAMGDQSGPVVQGLSILLQQLNDQLLSGGFDWFFNAVGNGMQMLGYAMQWVADNSSTLISVLKTVVIALAIYQTAMKMAAIMTEVMNLATGIASGNIFKIIASITGGIAGVAAFSLLDNLLPDTTQDGMFDNLDQAHANAKKEMANSKTPTLSAMNQKVQAEITNTAPIAVTGEVEIQKEVLRYQFDLAAQKAMAVFRMQQFVPQVIIQNQNVSQTADLNEINLSLGDMVYQNQQLQPAGVYA